jgi:hypothetical protein
MQLIKRNCFLANTTDQITRRYKTSTHNPEGALINSDIVNLGFVLNVIEERKISKSG